ncbi:hypothetical protein MAR_008581 [Mya arenaria]|uniref:Uncharacterized protein n=2 Tax=Mya arenaria TaxID=6604 RepID=A0ABY7DWC5_MYAAR|nr:hypothetical protein MAR_008581 [Mya arenaria]
MGKSSRSRANKRKKGSSTDEEIVNISKSYRIGGPADETEGQPLVSEILNQTNSVLFDDSSVFNESDCDNFDTSEPIHLPGAMASKVTPDVANADIATVLNVLEKLQVQMNNVEARLETLTVLEEKANSFDKDLKKLWTLVHDANNRFDEKLAKTDEKVEQIDFRQAEIASNVEQLEQQNMKMHEELVYLKSQKAVILLLTGWGVGYRLKIAMLFRIMHRDTAQLMVVETEKVLSGPETGVSVADNVKCTYSRRQTDKRATYQDGKEVVHDNGKPFEQQEMVDKFIQDVIEKARAEYKRQLKGDSKNGSKRRKEKNKDQPTKDKSSKNKSASSKGTKKKHHYKYSDPVDEKEILEYEQEETQLQWNPNFGEERKEKEEPRQESVYNRLADSLRSLFVCCLGKT